MILGEIDRSASPRADRRARIGLWLAAAAAGILLVSILIPPILEAGAGGGPSSLRLVFAPVCHQIGERSFSLLGAPLAVCARCAGLYLGGVLGLGSAAALVDGKRRRVRRAWLFALVLPTLADGLLAGLGYSPLATVGRFVLAVPAGGALGVLLAIGIHDLGLMIPGDPSCSDPAGDRRLAEEWP